MCQKETFCSKICLKANEGSHMLQSLSQFSMGKKLEKAKSNKADFLDLQLLVGVAKIRDPDLLLISFLASAWSVPRSQVVIRQSKVIFVTKHAFVERDCLTVK